MFKKSIIIVSTVLIFNYLLPYIIQPHHLDHYFNTLQPYLNYQSFLQHLNHHNLTKYIKYDTLIKYFNYDTLINQFDYLYFQQQFIYDNLKQQFNQNIFINQFDIQSFKLSNLENVIKSLIEQNNNTRRNSSAQLVNSEKIVHQKQLFKYNFASLNGGAKIIEKSNSIQQSNSLLSDNQDTYMFTNCDRNDMYLVLRLSEDILMESFEILNQEYYSRNVEKLKLWSCITYPCQSWQYLGEFTVKNNKFFQYFNLNKQYWTRFVKIELNSFHLNEYFYGVITQIKIYGTTMLVDLQNQFDQRQNKTYRHYMMKNHNQLSIYDRNRTEQQNFRLPVNQTEVFNMRQEFNNFTEFDVSLNLKQIHYRQFFDKYSINKQYETDHQPNLNKQQQINKINKRLNKNIIRLFKSQRLCKRLSDVRKFWLNFVKKKLKDSYCSRNRTISKKHELNMNKYQLNFKDHNDQQYQSIFTRLVSHINVLEENQMILQNFIYQQQAQNKQYNKFIKEGIRNNAKNIEYLNQLNEILKEDQIRKMEQDRYSQQKYKQLEEILGEYEKELQNVQFANQMAKNQNQNQHQNILNKVQNIEEKVFRDIDYLWCFLFTIIVIYTVFKKKINQILQMMIFDHQRRKQKMNNWETISESNQKDSNRVQIVINTRYNKLIITMIVNNSICNIDRSKRKRNIQRFAYIRSGKSITNSSKKVRTHNEIRTYNEI